MLVSTRGRYALRVLLDLAEHAQEGYVPMKAVAARQGISLKYLEQILPILSRNGLIEGVHGRGGGYRLSRAPQAYTAGEVLRLTEGELAPVSCLTSDAAPCTRRADCKTAPMWQQFYHLTNTYFDSITLADLLDGGAMPPARRAEAQHPV